MAQDAELDFYEWWSEHYDMAHLARGAAEDAWKAATERAAKIAGELLADAGHQTDLAPLVVAAIRRGTP